MSQRNEFFIPSTDGRHKLHCISYIPQNEPEKLFFIVHGMAEHIERYETFMQTLADNGFAVFAHDHVGHGKSVESDFELGFIAYQKGYKILINDVDEVVKYGQKIYPSAKLVVMGHSMGSFIARLYARQYGDKLSGLIVMGTGGSNPAAGAGIAVADVVKSVRGKKRISPFVNKLAFGKYNEKTEKKTPFDWLSTNENEVKKYIEDRYSGFDFTSSAMSDLIRLNRYSNKNDAYNVKKELNVFVVSGSEDPVGNYGKGPLEVCEKYRKAGVKSANVKLYEGARHEILNDFVRDEVVNDILGFVSSL